MGSKGLFTQCKTCNKEIAVSAKSCPHCGAKKKLSALQWVGISFAVLIVIGMFNNPDEQAVILDESEAIAIENQSASDVTTPQTQPVKIPTLPSEQVLFTNTVDKYVELFDAAKNELQESRLRELRRIDLSALKSTAVVLNWQGKIKQLETNTDGHAILSVRISPNIHIKTWNNSFSDIGSDTLILKNSSLYNSLFDLSVGETIEFSGRFFFNDIDHFKETSLTIRGSMREPEFLFRFDEVNPIN